MPLGWCPPGRGDQPVVVKCRSPRYGTSPGVITLPGARSRGTYALVRYADDVAIFCPTHAEAMEAKTLLAQWLASRGLRWSEAKTHIRHLTGVSISSAFTSATTPPPTAHAVYKLLITPVQAPSRR